MFNKFLIFLNLILIKQIQTGEIKLYYCNTKEKIDEVKNISANLKRFIGHGHKIYFILKKRIIFVKIISNIENDQNVILKFSNLNLIFYEQENNELTLPDSIPNQYKVFGYFYEESSKIIREIYSIDQDDQRTNRIYEKDYILNFEVTKTAQALAERSRSEYVKEPILLSELNKTNIKYFNLFKLDEKFKIFFKYSSIKNSTNHTILASLYFNDLRSRKKLDTQANLKFFTIHLISLSRISYVSINDKVNFINYELNYGKKIVFKIAQNISYDFDELFSCHTRFSNESQLKGIYFSRKQFFVFVKRFYLQIKDDLVLTGFKLADNLYETNAHVLKFEETEIYLNRSQQWWIKRKWVKTVGKELVFFGPEENSFYFELNTGNQDQLIYERTDASYSIRLRSCNQQTILINRHLFCWMESEYFYMYELNEESKYVEKPHAHNLISSIFVNSTVDWEKNQCVKFIFNYNDAKFVIMTYSHLFVFEYDQFNVTTEKIIFNPTNFRYLKLNNHLFNQIHINGGSNSTSNIFDSILAFILKFSITLSIVLVLLLVLVTVYASYNKIKNNTTELSKISEFLSYVKVKPLKSSNRESGIKNRSSSLELLTRRPSLLEKFKKFTSLNHKRKKPKCSKMRNRIKILKK